MDKRWERVLLAWCLYLVVLGLLLLGSAFGVTGQDDPAMGDRARLFAGISSALSFAVALLVLALLQATRGQPRQPRPWRTATLALLAWFVLDCGVSIATGFWTNSLSNALILVWFLVPVWGSGVLRR